MAKSRSDTPAVTTFADHEVIVPPNKLSQALSVSDGDVTPDLSPIARAEAALAQLSTEFDGWMRAECDRLDAARGRVREAGLSGDARGELFRASHDIKGEAATFGYPLAAEAAESLCRLLEHVRNVDHIPPTLIDQHVDGVRAIIRQDAKAGDATGAALVARLRAVTDEFLVRENRDRPGYLDGIVGPPLAPSP
jgi:HPt (histidine-containing phosphotransfer) domain-containing protein